MNKQLDGCFVEIVTNMTTWNSERNRRIQKLKRWARLTPSKNQGWTQVLVKG